MYLFLLFIIIIFPVAANAAPFFEPNPASNSRLIYLSEEGLDSNFCSITDPCKTIARGMSLMRRGYPDHLYLERGGEWSIDDVGSRDVPSGALSSPAVLGYYGNSGARPIIKTNGRAWDRLPMDNVVISGWNFVGMGRNPHKEDYVVGKKVVLSLLYASTNIRFDDVKFSYMGLVVQAATHTGGPSMWNNLMINRSIFIGSHSNESSFTRAGREANLYVAGVDGLTIEESTFDFGGWHPDVQGAAANQLSHCFYGQYGNPGNTLEVTGNIFSRCASHGLQVRWGGLVQDNFFARNSIAVTVGYHSTTAPVSPANTRFHLINNVVTEITSQYRGENPCEGVAVCTGAAWGIDLQPKIAGPDADFMAKDNRVGGYNFSADDGKVDPNVYKVPITQINDALYEGNIVNEDMPTLTTYAQHLKLSGGNLYDVFMSAVVNRPVGVWDPKIGARAINDYIRTGGASSKPQEKPLGKPIVEVSALELIHNSTFSESELMNMPSTYTLGGDLEGVWFARLGTGHQSSMLIAESDGDILHAGTGTTNGVMQVIPWPEFNHVALAFDYTGSPSVELLGGNIGDTISKYNSQSTLTPLNIVRPEELDHWVEYSEQVSLVAKYDFLVIRVKRGEVDNVSLQVPLLLADGIEPTLEDMPSNWIIDGLSDGAWVSRIGTCGQCSSLQSDLGNEYLKAAAGSSNGALLVKGWSNANINLSFLYRGGNARVRIYGAHHGDTVAKWYSVNSMSLLRDFPLEPTEQWLDKRLSIELQGDFDYMVIQVYRGDFDSFSVTE